MEGAMFSIETVATITTLIKNGTFGCAVFECNDIYATFKELKSKGVEFQKAPSREFYGIEAILKENSGNWFSLYQKK